MIYCLGDRIPEIAEETFIADNATIIGSVTLSTGVSVWFNAVLRGDDDEIFVGERSNVQDGAVLHTDRGIRLVVGREVTIGHMAMLHGCTIGDRTLVGIGARVLNRAVVGSDCIVGAGSLVPEGMMVPDGVVLMGSPARVARSLSPAEREALLMPAWHYVENVRRYRALKRFE